MRKLFISVLVVMLVGLALPAFANHPPASDGGVDVPWTNDMNQASYWSAYFGGDCTKYEGHGGQIPSQYEAAVVKSGSEFVRVYVDPPAQVLGPPNPNAQHPNRRFSPPFSWVMKCNIEEEPPSDTTTTSTVTTQPSTTTIPSTTTTSESPTTSPDPTIPSTSTTINPAPTTTAPTGSSTAPTSYCIDPNHATVDELMLVQGVTEEIAFAIVATTSFDGPFYSIADLQATYGLGNQVLEPVFPDWPGYFSDSCLTPSQVSPTTTIETTTTSLPTVVDTSVPDDPETPRLPVTGAGSSALALGGLLALLAGVGLLWRARSE